MNKPPKKRDEFLDLLRNAAALTNTPYEPTNEQKDKIAQECLENTVKGNHPVEWTIDGVYEKLDEYGFRCAITGIPRSQSKLTMDRITDVDSTYCVEHTTPMLPELNMAKGTMDHIVHDQESIRIDDFQSQREEMIAQIQVIVQYLIEHRPMIKVEETVRLNSGR